MEVKSRLHLVDITDVLKHILATGEIGGISRLLATIIEARAGIENLHFCIFLEAAGCFMVIGNTKSIDFALLSRFNFERHTDNLNKWVEECEPKLLAVESLVAPGVVPHYYFLSSQWDTFPSKNDNVFLANFLKSNEVSFLHHDSYLLQNAPNLSASKRFKQYWETVVANNGRIIFISEHTRAHFIILFGKPISDVVARYDFLLSYPEVTEGVDENAIGLSLSKKPFLLVFSILDGRKKPVELIRELCNQTTLGRYNVALIVRFMSNDSAERIGLIDLVVNHNLHVFYTPNDATYLWLVKNAASIYYPSAREGFGMVPLDCKRFGKKCFVPEGADYSYLHNNVEEYSNTSHQVPIVSVPCKDNLSTFSQSKFAKTLFTC